VAIKWISASHKTALQEDYPSTDRVYLDLRQFIYPPVDSTLTYTLITSAANQPGSHNVTGGGVDYLYEMPSQFTVFARAQAAFTVATAVDHPLWSFYGDANNYCNLMYDQATNQIQVKYKDGTTERVLISTTFTATSLLSFKNITAALKLGIASTTGSVLYIDGSVEDSAWSGTIDICDFNHPLFSVRHQTSVTGSWDINQIRLFPGIVATATDVANIFKDRKEEEITWNYNGEGCGRTRCNVSRWVTSMALERSVEEPTTGSQGANRFSCDLMSPLGQFADEQYAAFDPTLDQFNGTQSQTYMQKRSRIEAETWYGTGWELYFTGRLDEGMYQRNSTVADVTRVSLAAEDSVSDIGRMFKRHSRRFEDYELSNTSTESTSLIHEMTRLTTKPEVYNFLANSSFENATVANSWTVAGALATFSRVAGGIFGSYQGDLVVGSTIASVTQLVTFLGTKRLNVGESYTFSGFLKSATTVTASITLAETLTALTITDASTTACAVGLGTGWQRYEVTHTVTGGTSNRLRATIRESTTSITLSMDGVQLTQSGRALPFWALNNNDSAATAVTAADSADYGSYDTVGFDVDPVAITHPWASIPVTESVWDHLKQVADATGCMYLGMDACGTLKMRSKLKTGYADPATIEAFINVAGLNSSVELRKANKIIGHGVSIVKSDQTQVMWMLSAAGIAGTQPWVAVANGLYFPDVLSSMYSNFWAKYGTVV